MRKVLIVTLFIVLAGALLATSSVATASDASQPAPSHSHAKASCTNPYVVKWGDTLAKIAARCGTTATVLKRWNGLKSNLIRPGQVLVTRATAARAAAPSTTSRTTSRSAAPAASPAPSSRSVIPSPTPRIEPPIAP